MLDKLFKREQKITRVNSIKDLHKAPNYISFWNTSQHSDAATIKKIYEHLKTARSIRIYISHRAIEYTADTLKFGIVTGSCHKWTYDFFEFGVYHTGHRYDIYGEDRGNSDVDAFYDWWKSVVYKYEKEFEKDVNL